MVDVGDKPFSKRVATASGRVQMRPDTLSRLQAGPVAKGDVLEVARLAGISAAKQTWQLIPLCHVLPLEAVDVYFAYPDDTSLEIVASVTATAKTGVEMEALTAVSLAALTIYDMCKSIDREMVIHAIQLETKSGGTRGDFRRQSKPL